MEKQYEFCVVVLTEYEGFHTMGYYTKGHHDKKKFVEKIKQGYNKDVEVEQVRYCWGKFIPCGEPFVTLLHEFNEPKKHTFPMTYVDV